MHESYGISEKERLTPDELADILGITSKCLGDWRRRKVGPPYVRMVGRVFYPKVALEEWLKDHLHLPEM